MPEHILVLGATGVVGLLFCEEALSQGHTLNLLVRNPGKLPEKMRSHPRVNIIEGQITDKSVLEKVASSGASVFMSFAGPTAGSKGTIIGGSAYEEFSGLGKVVSSFDSTKLKWTLFRVPFLRNGEAAPVTETYTGSGKDGMFLSRKSIVAWTLKEMGQDSDWVGKTPVLCN